MTRSDSCILRSARALSLSLSPQDSLDSLCYSVSRSLCSVIGVFSWSRFILDDVYSVSRSLYSVRRPAFRAGPEITGTATHTQNNPPESIFTQNARLLVEGLAHALEGPLATPALALRDGPLGLGLPLYSVLLVGLFLVLLGLFILDSLWLDGLLVGLFILLVGLFIVYC
jgi:hypothetical protein